MAWLIGATAVLTSVALTLGILAFTTTIARSRHLESVLAAEVHRHCVTDAHVSNLRRALDIALIAADHKHLAVLHTELPRAATGHDRALIQGEITWLTAVVGARHADQPAYINPATC